MLRSTTYNNQSQRTARCSAAERARYGTQHMGANSQIVAGGGWKGTRVERVEVKAWAALVGAIGLGGISQLAVDSIGFYAYIPAGASLLTSLVLFVRERPRGVELPGDPAGHDLWNLYASSGGASHKKGKGSAEPRTVPQDDPRDVACQFARQEMTVIGELNRKPTISPALEIRTKPQ